MSIGTMSSGCSPYGLIAHFLGDDYEMLKRLSDNLDTLGTLANEIAATGVLQLKAEDLYNTPVFTGRIVSISNKGKEGLFICKDGAIPDDPLKGLYYPSATAEKFWARIWDGVSGKPEWFGAIANDPTINCAPAIEACAALCRVTQLPAVDYYITRMLFLGKSNTTVRGVRGAPDVQGQSTRIILTGPACAAGNDILYCGRLAAPQNVTGCVDELHVSGLVLRRDFENFPCSPPATNKILDCDTGMVVAWCFNSNFIDIQPYGNRTGIKAKGMVASEFYGCKTNTYNGIVSAPAGDNRNGYVIGGAQAELGFAGANASLRVSKCSAVGTAGVNSTGILLYGACVDTFIDDFESAQIPFGIVIDGSDLSGNNANILNRGDVVNLPYAHQDIRVHKPTLDACSGAGILICNINSSGAIELEDVYAAINGTASGLQLKQTLGQITVRGGQALGIGAGFGFKAENAANFKLDGFKVRDCAVPVYLTGCHQFDICPQVSNISYAAAGAAIVLSAANTRGKVSGIVSGLANMFTAGVTLETTSTLCEVNTSSYDPGAFTNVSAAYKVRYNNLDARNNTAFTDAGNVLTGVLG